MSSQVPSTGSITFIGGGNMARSLIGGLRNAGAPAEALHVVEPRAEARDELHASFGIAVHAQADADALVSETVVLAVKPQVIKGVCEALREPLGAARPLLLSIAAGIRMGQLDRWLGDGHAIVRCMPNTPALIGAGATGLCANDKVDAGQRQRAAAILSCAGLTRWVEDEALMDTVTALSGSGPAYFFAFVEALEDAAAAQGLPRGVARALACQTCLGAGRMLVASDDAPGELRRKVTSPGGTTAAALDSFAADDLAQMVARAVAAATKRGQTLSAGLD